MILFQQNANVDNCRKQRLQQIWGTTTTVIPLIQRRKTV